MNRIKNLNYYQKGILLVMLAMAIIFAAIYPKTISRVGYEYEDAILVPREENGTTVYSGKIKGKLAEFIVSNENNTVDFRHGDKNYGQYILKSDPTAIPKEEELANQMKGIEISNGDRIVFRGGVFDVGDSYWFYNQDGTLDYSGLFSVTSGGIEVDENGNEIDQMEPSVYTIYELLHEPKLTHKGEALAWFGAVFICILNGITMLFADELFRLNLSFQIRNVEKAEPSDWEIMGRYIGWTVMTIGILVIFIAGLQ